MSWQRKPEEGGSIPKSWGQEQDPALPKLLYICIIMFTDVYILNTDERSGITVILLTLVEYVFTFTCYNYTRPVNLTTPHRHTSMNN